MYGYPNSNQPNYPPPQGYGGYGPPQGATYDQSYGSTGPYGVPPSQPPYGVAPPSNTYGLPGVPFQSGQYIPPPPHNGPSPQPYGAPPSQPWAAPSPYPPSPIPHPSAAGTTGANPRFLGVNIPSPPPAVPLSNLQGYNAQFDAERIRKATKGFGTDEKSLIDVLAPLDAFQMDVLSRTYEQMVGKSLRKTLEKELSGWVEYTLVLLSLGPLHGDLHLLERACKGAGTHEDLLTEILLGRTNEEMFFLKEGFRRLYGKDLISTVKGELSMQTERMFNMALSGTKDESPYINQQVIQQDVETLYRAGPGRIGTDEISVCGILLSRSDAHLQAIAQQFPQRHRVSLSQMIHSEFSGHMRDSLLYIAHGAEADGHGVNRDANMLEAAMAGVGTKDERMIYRIIRAHWNRPRFGAIKNQYQVLHGRTLRHRVESETTGKYEKALVAIIDMN
ncbi:hypothetical protein TREMEDRAFT_70412 [Tremella mesenterica DSM 1558]|uniref:uncharacterized protein n=1 Tax=Tremella mesenterica (strain ATCC 24925 / CBS 8224 / DSM 1558 / NBRC 9311 / NRRL Y-6157 / RJB 2259-6 / UBC 559-6) TaxID=578456 RepID=UPI00032BECDE|nr:uncharacterized protein TREMEDRAFT_70412 [Tremella mesenterica DSM 1558]EIW65745.1 hypothetical protein TREMEDRAFT_70412 [Tremella mesenterica DSM 1558]